MIYRFYDYTLDPDDFSLLYRSQRVALEPKSTHVLLLLVTRAGRLVSKDALLDSVWKDTCVDETNLTRAIALLRRQLGDDHRDARFIQTVRTLGYRFIAPVDCLQPDRSMPNSNPADLSPVRPAELSALRSEPPSPPGVSHAATGVPEPTPITAPLVLSAVQESAMQGTAVQPAAMYVDRRQQRRRGADHLPATSLSLLCQIAGALDSASNAISYATALLTQVSRLQQQESLSQRAALHQAAPEPNPGFIVSSNAAAPCSSAAKPLSGLHTRPA